MRSQVSARLLVALLLGLTTVACGSSDDETSSSNGGTATSTTSPPSTAPSSTAPEPSGEGSPIEEPVCDFIDVSAEDAASILDFGVTARSQVGENDPDGGTCTYTPNVGGAGVFEVAVAVFPDTAEEFEAFVERHTERRGPTGRRLWTPPTELEGLGERAFSFKSPDGGFDSVFVFAGGYRVLVLHETTTDVAGAAEKIEAMAEAVTATL